MVSVIKRMTKLRTLLALRLGPGAAKLPPEVTKIHMDFAAKIDDGHMGPRKFLRHCLTRMKYHNPAIPMTVSRTTDQEGPAVMTIHFSDRAASSTAAAISSTTAATGSTGSGAASTSPMPVVRTETIQMKHRHESEILKQLIMLTKAEVVLATPEETQEIEDLRRKRIESAKVSMKAKAAKEARKRAEAVVAQARASATAVA